MIDLDLAAELEQLADAIGRMRPPQSNKPDAFHEDRSELRGRCLRLAQRCKTGQQLSAPADVPEPIGRQAVTHATRHIKGRTILVLTRRQPGASHPFY